jgi:hypothetical protein
MHGEMKHQQVALRVCLIAPLPPPYGGIANWTQLVRRYALVRSDFNLDIVDTSPRWRAIDDIVLWKRAAGGGYNYCAIMRDFCDCYGNAQTSYT